MDAARVPQHRADIKGSRAVIMRECADMMRGESSSADFFVFEFADLTLSVGEYAQYLTDAELATCFKRAMK